MPYPIIMCFFVMDIFYLTTAEDNSTTLGRDNDMFNENVANSENLSNSDGFLITTFGPIAGPIVLIAVIACCIYFCARHCKYSRNGYTREQLTSEENTPNENNRFPRRRNRFFRRNWRNWSNQNRPPPQTNVIIQPVVPIFFPSQNQPTQMPNLVNQPYASAPPQMCTENTFNANFIPGIPPPIPPPPYFEKN